MRENKRFKKITSIILFTVIFLFCLYITYLLLPMLLLLKDEPNRLYFKAQIESLGIIGFFIVIGLQILQIVIAFIPGDFIELFAGMVYGIWGGLFVCLLGIFLANLLVYLIVKKTGSLFKGLFNNKKVMKFQFLQNTRRLELIIFFIYFIPIIPKDAITYFVPATNISLKRFMVISLVARTPAIFSMTYMGNSLMDGNIWQFIAILFISGLTSLVGIVFYDDLLSLFENKK